MTDHLKASHTAETRYHVDAIVGLRRQYDQVRERLGTLLDLRLDKSITQAEYDEKARALKTQQAEIATRIVQHEKGDGAFRTTLETLISVASRAADLFERSKIDQKRQLLAFVFSNLRLRGKKLEYSMRPPFHLMANQHGHAGWLPFLNTYRTMCMAPDESFRRILEAVQPLSAAA